MQPIKELLNKIKWDKREAPEQYSIFYFDRILKTLRNSKRISGAQKISKKFSGELIEIPYKKIKKIEDNFMVLNNEEESNIPLHRVRKVTKNDIIVWERKL